MKQSQQAFETILEDSFKQYEKRFLSYMVTNREKYKTFAHLITPNLQDKEQIYSRICFAILSANVPFDRAVSCLNFCLEHKGKVRRDDMAARGMYPNKADYVNEAWDKIKRHRIIKGMESWQDYRIFLQANFLGLGTAKASFAACLLYPLKADLACIDTWMQKVFLHHTSFKQISLEKYEQVEAKIRSYAQKVGVNTFLAQWMIWDHARKEVNNHAIFPGSHK